MNELTAEKCRELLKERYRQRDNGDISIGGAYTLQALEIALPILEQQEQKQKVSVREGLAALSAHIDSIGGYNFEALEAYRMEVLGQQDRVRVSGLSGRAVSVQLHSVRLSMSGGGRAVR